MTTATRPKLTAATAACALLAPTGVTFSTLAMERDGPDGPRRAFKMEAYNGAVFDHPYLGRAVIDVAGIKVPDGGVPALRQHRPEMFVGRCEKVSLEGGRVAIEGFLFDGVEAADEVARISDQGGKWQASIKVDPVIERIEFVALDADVTVNGVALVGPIAVLRESTLTESSFVPRGADTSTSALALSHQPAAAPPAHTPKKEPTMDPVTAERARVKSIREAFPKHRTFADEQIDKGVSLADAKAAFSDVALAELAEHQKAGEVALAAEKARADAAEKKAEAALKQTLKPDFGAQLGAAQTGASTGAGDEKDPIRRWDVALAAEVESLRKAGSDEVEDLSIRRGIALSADANLRAVAVARLSSREPKLREEMVAEFNARGIGSRQRNNKG